MKRILPDEEILKWIKNQDTKQKGMTLLVENFQEQLYWHIRKMVLSHDDSKDILQEVFLRVFRKIETFRGESSLFTWLYRIATHEMLRHIEKKERQTKNAQKFWEGMLENELSEGLVKTENEIENLLQKAILQLSVKQKMVFNMRYFDDLSYEDMSEILDSSVNNLKVTYHNARLKIENLIKQEIG